MMFERRETIAFPRNTDDGARIGLQINFTNDALNVSLSLGPPPCPLVLGKLRDVNSSIGSALHLLPSKGSEFGSHLRTAADQILWIAASRVGSLFACIGIIKGGWTKFAIQCGLGLCTKLNIPVPAGHTSSPTALRVEAIGREAETTTTRTDNTDVDGRLSNIAKKVTMMLTSVADQLRLFFLQPYSIEPNPDERVWNDPTNNSLGRKYISSFVAFKCEVIASLRFIQNTPERVISSFRTPVALYATVRFYREKIKTSIYWN